MMVQMIYIYYREILLIKLILLTSFFSCSAQFLPTSVGVHHKKSSSVSDESFATLMQNGAYGIATYSRQGDNKMSTYSVSIWIKSRDSHPANWKSAFSTHKPNNKGFQLDSNGSKQYRYQMARGGGGYTFGSNTIKTSWVHLAAVADGDETKLYYNGTLVRTINDVAKWG